jgi:hypothetical protein
MSRLALIFAGVVIVAGTGCRKSKPPETARIASGHTEAASVIHNAESLKQIEAYLSKFDAEQDSYVLAPARRLLESVQWRAERDPTRRAEVRARSLTGWLRLLAILDGFLDPAFDKDDVPVLNISPPSYAGEGGVDLMPDTDPDLIVDPAVRAQYVAAVAANREKQKRYALQATLRRMNEGFNALPQWVEAFIRHEYASDPGDQAELRTAIDQIITNPARKAGLLKLLSPSHP